MIKDLKSRVEALEDDARGSPPDIVASATDEEFEALAILMHELEHPRGAEITPEVAAEVEKRVRSRRRS